MCLYLCVHLVMGMLSSHMEGVPLHARDSLDRTLAQQLPALFGDLLLAPGYPQEAPSHQGIDGSLEVHS